MSSSAEPGHLTMPYPLWDHPWGGVLIFNALLPTMFAAFVLLVVCPCYCLARRSRNVRAWLRAVFAPLCDPVVAHLQKVDGALEATQRAADAVEAAANAAQEHIPPAANAHALAMAHAAMDFRETTEVIREQLPPTAQALRDELPKIGNGAASVGGAADAVRNVTSEHIAPMADGCRKTITTVGYIAVSNLLISVFATLFVLGAEYAKKRSDALKKSSEKRLYLNPCKVAGEWKVFPSRMTEEEALQMADENERQNEQWRRTLRSLEDEARTNEASEKQVLALVEGAAVLVMLPLIAFRGWSVMRSVWSSVKTVTGMARSAIIALQVWQTIMGRQSELIDADAPDAIDEAIRGLENNVAGGANMAVNAAPAAEAANAASAAAVPWDDSPDTVLSDAELDARVRAMAPVILGRLELLVSDNNIEQVKRAVVNLREAHGWRFTPQAISAVLLTMRPSVFAYKRDDPDGLSFYRYVPPLEAIPDRLQRQCGMSWYYCSTCSSAYCSHAWAPLAPDGQPAHVDVAPISPPEVAARFASGYALEAAVFAFIPVAQPVHGPREQTLAAKLRGAAQKLHSFFKKDEVSNAVMILSALVLTITLMRWLHARRSKARAAEIAELRSKMPKRIDRSDNGEPTLAAPLFSTNPSQPPVHVLESSSDDDAQSKEHESGRGQSGGKKKRIRRKPWIDYDDDGSAANKSKSWRNMNNPEVLYVDETGRTATRAGRRAAKSAFDRFMHIVKPNGKVEESTCSLVSVNPRDESIRSECSSFLLPCGWLLEVCKPDPETGICSKVKSATDSEKALLARSAEAASAPTAKTPKSKAPRQEATTSDARPPHKNRANAARRFKKKLDQQHPGAVSLESLRAELSASKPKLEAHITGQPATLPATIIQSVGVVTVSTKSLTGHKEIATNALRAWTGVIVPVHLFSQGRTNLATAVFKSASGDEYSTVLDSLSPHAMEIGHDTLYFPLAKVGDEGAKNILTHIPAAKMGVFRPELADNLTVRVFAWPSLASLRAGTSCLSPGSVVLKTAGSFDERGVDYTCNTDAGYCCGPVLNRAGHVVGLHNYTTGSVNGFIPVTQKMRDAANAVHPANATGSTSSAPLAQSN